MFRIMTSAETELTGLSEQRQLPRYVHRREFYISKRQFTRTEEVLNKYVFLFHFFAYMFVVHIENCNHYFMHLLSAPFRKNAYHSLFLRNQRQFMKS